MIGTHAPGYLLPPEAAPEQAETSAETQTAGRHDPGGLVRHDRTPSVVM